MGLLKPSAGSVQALVLLFPEAAVPGAHGLCVVPLSPALNLPPQDTESELDLFCEVEAVFQTINESCLRCIGKTAECYAGSSQHMAVLDVSRILGSQRFCILGPANTIWYPLGHSRKILQGYFD